MTRTFRPSVDPDASPDPVRVGVLASTSMVARLAVVPALEASPRAEVVARASRSQGQTYDSVTTDPDVEAVYLPLPNGHHRDWTERAAAAGKHVLCEKPLALTAADARAMAEACQRAGVVLMEAYMTEFHPRAVALLDLVASGRLGQILTVDATFTFPLLHERSGDHRFDPVLGGGALADVGIYVLTPIFDIAAASGQPEPTSISTQGRAVDATGAGPVDATTTGSIAFPGGMVGRFTASMEAPEAQRLEVVGTLGRVRLDHAFTPDESDDVLVIEFHDGATETVDGLGADPYRLMVDHFCGVVRGLTEPRRPPAVSVAFADLCDRIRADRTAS